MAHCIQTLTLMMAALLHAVQRLDLNQGQIDHRTPGL